MLEQIDLSKKVHKELYKEKIAELKIKLGILQRRAKEFGIPITIVFEGWDAAGKGTMINELLLAMDPRGFVVHKTKPPDEEEIFRPFLWRFWTKTPGKGRIAIFDRSWYMRVLSERIDKIVPKKIWLRAFNEITSFERQLTDDGNVIIKFFLHISKKEQKKRFEKLQENKYTKWRVSKEDWRHHEQYEEYLIAIEDMLTKTDTEFAPWTIVEAHDRRFATLKIFQTVINAVEKRIIEIERQSKEKKVKDIILPEQNILNSSILSKIDLSKTLTREEYEKELKKYQDRIRELEHLIYSKRIPVVIVYQGWDAAGKGGNIKRLVEGLDPRGYQVIPISAPNDVEKIHHYLWRFWIAIPKAGHIAIFDRSWYGRVLDERIEGFCTEEEWKRAFREINEFEQQLVDFGTVLIKFWLHIDKEEQLRRFEDRKNTPHKQWKLGEEDWRNRAKWDNYLVAIDEMLYRTSNQYAPWTVIESNCKLYARIKALKTVVEEVEKKL